MKEKSNRHFKNILFLAAIFPSCVCASEVNSLTNITKALGQPSFSSNVVQLFLLLGVLGVAPSIVVMCTSFVRISIVFSIVKTAIGLQQAPPAQVLNSLALFLTFFIMEPALREAYQDGIRPMISGSLSEEVAMPRVIYPFKKFMIANTRSKDLELFASMAKLKMEEFSDTSEVPIHVVAPSFMVGELRKGFEVGFLLFLPFLVIDVVVACVLMSVGMLMMPPTALSLPLKVAFFVFVDGWSLITGSLIKSFNF